MSTWGPSKKKSARASAGRGRQGTRSRWASPGRGADPTVPSRRPDDATPVPPTTTAATGRGRRRPEPVVGRQHEMAGVIFVGVGLLLALALYADLAGPLGRGLSTLLAIFIGLGRYAVPVVLVVMGVALIRRGQSASPKRLAIGWALVAGCVLGMLHVLKGPDGFSPVDEIRDAGGYIGAVLAEPLQSLVASAGAIVVALALGIGGLLLITQTSLRSMAANTGSGVAAVARPVGRAARQALRDLSSLSSEREPERTVIDTTAAGDDPARRELPGPTLYDAAGDFGDDAPPPAGAARRDRTSRRSRPDRSRAVRSGPGSSHRPRCCVAVAPRRSTGPRSKAAARCCRSRWSSTAS